MSRIYESFKTIRSIERGEPQSIALGKLAAEHMENIRNAAEQQITDMLTYGQSFAKQTSYPPKLEHKKMGDLARAAKQPVTVELNEEGEIKEMSDGTKYRVTSQGWKKIDA